MFSRLLIALAALLMVGSPGVLQAQTAGGGPGDEVCLDCHVGPDSIGPPVPTVGSADNPRFAIWNTRHGVSGDGRTPAANGGCIACHGDATAHVEDPGSAKPFSFGPETPAEERSAVCLKCHKGGQRMFWDGGHHDSAGVACNDCHNPHETADQVRVKETQAGVCFTCHKDIRAAIFRPSTHPLRNGQMACSNCHNPHGSPAPFQLVKESVNETCYQCHAEKRGPFLWEHPPAREDCTNCHAPHGSVNPPMLKARGPYLCQQCHDTQYHPGTPYSGTNLPGNTGGGTSFDKMLGQQCANCHSKIHGSNHPSGARFTR